LSVIVSVPSLASSQLRRRPAGGLLRPVGAACRSALSLRRLLRCGNTWHPRMRFQTDFAPFLEKSYL